jgi:hypothetical protein
MTDNLALWEAVEKTPHNQTKEITGKAYKGNSPKPHYLVWKATETFGPCGIGWGFEIVEEKLLDGALLESGFCERIHMARVRVWYKWKADRGEVEHVGQTVFSGKRKDGKPFTDEDAPKKSVTDALIKALSMIGFAGDIFMGRYDDSKYVADLKAEELADKAPAPRADKPAITPAYVIKGAKDADDYIKRLVALVAGAPNAAAVQAINDANRAALDRLATVDRPKWDIAMQALSDRTTAVLERTAA